MKKLNSLIAMLMMTTILYGEKFILIDLDSQMGYAYENGDLKMSGRVSTGKKDFRTPRGYYNILEKKRYHRSNLWPKPNGGAKMDYMLRLTNTGIAMHLGAVPKYPASPPSFSLSSCPVASFIDHSAAPTAKLKLKLNAIKNFVNIYIP